MDTVIRELLPQQQPRTIERRDLQYITISKEELSSSDSLSPDPWKRDAREKAEKQQQLHIVDLLDKEIQDLQVSVDVFHNASPVCSEDKITWNVIITRGEMRISANTGHYYTMCKISSANMGFKSANIGRYYTTDCAAASARGQTTINGGKVILSLIYFVV